MISTIFVGTLQRAVERLLLLQSGRLLVARVRSRLSVSVPPTIAIISKKRGEPDGGAALQRPLLGALPAPAITVISLPGSSSRCILRSDLSLVLSARLKMLYKIAVALLLAGSANALQISAPATPMRYPVSTAARMPAVVAEVREEPA